MRKTTFTSITVDGQTYGSVDEMPADVRAKYERVRARLMADRDGNGIPDVFETGTTVDGDEVTHVTSSYSEVYDINGEQYTRLDDMPPDLRRLVEHIRTPAGPRAQWPRPPGGSAGGLNLGVNSSAGAGGIRVTWRALAWLLAGLILAALWLAWAMRAN